jgi:mRNA export factor
MYDTTLSDKGDSKSFCFKCHRKEPKDSKQAEVYAVNGFCFNKKKDTFYSFGGNGEWVSWNKDTRAKYKNSGERIKEGYIAPPIVAGDLTEDASIFAYAYGYDWSQGAEG